MSVPCVAPVPLPGYQLGCRIVRWYAASPRTTGYLALPLRGNSRISRFHARSDEPSKRTQRHRYGLAAPTAQTPIVFEDATFAAGERVRTEYRFNSYRAGAVYSFAPRGKWSFRAGATLKVRDAKIALASDTASAEKTNVGVVPLLYGGMRYQATPRVAFDLDADGAAASQGRALDVAARVESALSDRVALYGGARLLEGGADNDEVFSFGTFAYAIGGLRVRW